MLFEVTTLLFSAAIDCSFKLWYKDTTATDKNTSSYLPSIYSILTIIFKRHLVNDKIT